MLSPKQKAILHLLIDREQIPIAEFSKPESTPALATVYRSLEFMESLRVRNDRGVLSLFAETAPEPQTNIARRLRTNPRQKAGVAKYIVRILAARQNKGEACGPLFLDCGSACAAIGKEIVEQKAPHCHILTINPVVIADFAFAPDVGPLEVMHGEVDWNKGAIFTSPDDIRGRFFRTAAIGVDYVSSDGKLYQRTSQGVDQKNAMMVNAQELFFPVEQNKVLSSPCEKSSTDHGQLLEHSSGRIASFVHLPVPRGKIVWLVIGVENDPGDEFFSLLKKVKEKSSEFNVVAVNPAGQPVAEYLADGHNPAPMAECSAAPGRG